MEVPQEEVSTVSTAVGWTEQAVFVHGSDASGAEREYYVYDIHHRFRDLRSQRIDARLQLATSYAATGSLVPEDAAQMTG